MAWTGTQLRGGVHQTPPFGVVDRINVRGPWVALSFADGPNPHITPAIVRVLVQHGATATFFAVGVSLMQDRRDVMVMTQAGDDVESHTMGHINLASHSYRVDYRDLEAENVEIRALTGRTPRWLYPPYGAIDGTAVRAALAAHLTVILPSPGEGISPRVRRPATIIQQVLSHVHAGAIIVLPDRVDDRAVLQALPRLLHLLHVEGYRVGSVTDVQRYARQ